jgi:hypothetical protein
MKPPKELVNTYVASILLPQFAKAKAEEEAQILRVRAVTNWTEAQVLMAAELFSLTLEELYHRVAAGEIRALTDAELVEEIQRMMARAALQQAQVVWEIAETHAACFFITPTAHIEVKMPLTAEVLKNWSPERENTLLPIMLELAAAHVVANWSKYAEGGE